MNHLMLHTGGYTVTQSEVFAVHTPQPTESHVPIPHGQLIDLTFAALHDSGYRIVQQSHALANGGMNYFGLFELKGENPDSALVVGLRNSHIKMFKAGLVAGSRVFVCDNLAFQGQVSFGRKHTLNIQRDIAPLVTLAVGKIADLRQTEVQRITRYQETALELGFADHLMMGMIRNGVIPPTKIKAVCGDFMHPQERHPEFAEWRGTVYGLYLAVTEHIKGSPFTLPKRSQKLHALLDGWAAPNEPLFTVGTELAESAEDWELEVA